MDTVPNVTYRGETLLFDKERQWFLLKRFWTPANPDPGNVYWYKLSENELSLQGLGLVYQRYMADAKLERSKSLNRVT